MQYGIYLDVYFLVNCGMDLVLLLILRRILKVQAKLRRLILAGMAGAAFSCLAVLWWDMPAALYLPAEVILPAAVMVQAAFRPLGFRVFLKELLILLLEAFLMGGVMETVYQHMENGWNSAGRPGMPFLFFLLAAALAAGTVYILWDWGFEIRKERRTLFRLSLEAAGRRIETTGYLDTGNRLRNPENGRPVHIVSEKVWKLLYSPETEVFWIPYHTVGNALGMMEGMEVAAMEIWWGKGRKTDICGAVIAKSPCPLCEDGSYDVLLHGSAEQEAVQAIQSQTAKEDCPVKTLESRQESR